MSSVVLDPQTLEQLRRPGGRVEIRDPAGELVGYFTPSLAAPDDARESPIGADELRRRAQQGGGRTLSEILDNLEPHA